jgi:tRNA dimethylallyltransferase
VPETCKRFPVICGPTAGGKSALALALARALRADGQDAEIVTADAYQVYRGMDIGTAKPTPAERAEVVHHVVDVVEPAEAFSVERWRALAEGAIEVCRARGVVPIVVGGSHLFIKALLEGLFEGPGQDAALRAQLQAMDAHERRVELERVDPQAALRIHRNDVRRTVRALEVFRLTGVPISAHQQQWRQSGGGDGEGEERSRPDALLVSLQWPTEALNRRINQRVCQMMQQGLLEEVRALAPTLGPTAREALGYKQLLGLVEQGERLGKWPPPEALVDEATERIKIETRRFAKNQRTWLKNLRLTPGGLALACGEGTEPGVEVLDLPEQVMAIRAAMALGVHSKKP